ncbi:hypothetical protein COU56_02845, partial [Candidatus Pacearchaeota archaeon CG10_big_fil_rev_8_21_14_0_10_31_9]
MSKREVVKKRESLFLALNIIISVVAFSFLVGLSVPSVSAQASAGPVPGYPNTNPQGKKAPPPVTTIPVATEATDTSSNNNLPDVLRFADLEKNSGSLEGKLIYSPDGKENLVFQGIETKDGQKLAKFLKTDGTYTYINQNNLDQAGGINLKGATSPTALSGGTGKLAKILGVESPVTGNLIQGVQWAAIAYLVVPFIGEMLGLEEPTTKALQYGVSSGLFAYNAAQALGFSETGLAQSSVGSWIGGHAAIFGVGVGVVVFALSYKKVEYKRVDFICDPWQAPIGGDDCEKCNDGMNPCSEYRCKSLGQACGIVNKGTEDEKCVWLNPRDVNSPIIRAWDDALKVE